MQIRFLQTVASDNAFAPFVAGQVIDVPAPSPYLLSLLDGVRAEAVSIDDMERAVEPAPVRSEPVRKGKRDRRVVV